MDVKMKSKFGRSRFGGSAGALIGLSLGGGVLFSALFATVMIWLQKPERLGVYAVIYFIVMLPVMIGIVWLLLVDRESILGAVRNPENSVESTWYSAAAEDTFHAAMVLGGIGCLIFPVWSVEASVSTVLLISVAAMQVIFWISYGIRKRRSL